MKKVLITGVTGFVGSTLVYAFRDHPEIKVFGNSRDIDTAKKKFLDTGIEYISECSARLLDENGIDCIIHLAGIAHDLSNSYKDADYFRVNFQDTTKLYNEFLKSRATKFIYVSSIKAVVDVLRESLTETIVPNPVTPYGKSKLKVEEYILANAMDEKQYYILRPCMIHGPGNKGNLNLLYRFVKKGIPYPLGAFNNKRSFLGADNLAFIMERLVLNPIPSGIYNLADEGSMSTADVVQIIGEVLGRRSRIWNLPTGPIRILFSMAGKKAMLEKLTESMEVSNAKILKAVKASLPVSIKEGLRKTITSFHE